MQINICLCPTANELAAPSAQKTCVPFEEKKRKKRYIIYIYSLFIPQLTACLTKTTYSYLFSLDQSLLLNMSVSSAVGQRALEH